MLDKRKFRIVAFVCAAIVLLAVMLVVITEERQYCMDVPLIQENKLTAYTQTDTLDIGTLTFNGDPIAADYGSKTIYLSQSPKKLWHLSQLEGVLESSEQSYSLYFLKDQAIEDIRSSVCNNVPLTLILSDGVYFQKVPVVITTLPVIRIEGVQDGWVLSGDITLWAGENPHTEHSSVQKSLVQWHVRGVTSATASKKPWKLSLKDLAGENNHLDFLGMGADDDWILNAMAFDDIKIREKLFMDLWNENAKQVEYQYKMSTGEYAELVINGKYLGLFLLQRRVDAKYLELSEEDILLKGTYYQATCAEEAYELVTAAENAEKAYAAMKPVFEKAGNGAYCLENIIDTNLFIQFASALDNYGLKNIYHVLKGKDMEFDHYLVPWDTDMSFGLVYDNNTGTFVYNYEATINHIATRAETGGEIKENPQYDELAAARWQMLRKTLLSEENLLARVDRQYTSLLKTGALIRDKQLWSERYGGEDTVDNMKRFIHERLLFMDAYYGN